MVTMQPAKRLLTGRRSMLNLDYPGILKLFDAHRDPKRTDSASFLIWYLEHYYRLNTLDAVYCVCDQSGDKGVDGIYLNEDTNTIDVFQSKLSQDPKKTLGDSLLREFRGTLSQFDSVETLENLVKNRRTCRGFQSYFQTRPRG